MWLTEEEYKTTAHVRAWRTALSQDEEGRQNVSTLLLLKWMGKLMWCTEFRGVMLEGLVVKVDRNGYGKDHPKFTIKVIDPARPDVVVEVSAPFERFALV